MNLWTSTKTLFHKTSRGATWILEVHMINIPVVRGILRLSTNTTKWALILTLDCLVSRRIVLVLANAVSERGGLQPTSEHVAKTADARFSSTPTHPVHELIDADGAIRPSRRTIATKESYNPAVSILLWALRSLRIPSILTWCHVTTPPRLKFFCTLLLIGDSIYRVCPESNVNDFRKKFID